MKIYRNSLALLFLTFCLFSVQAQSRLFHLFNKRVTYEMTSRWPRDKKRTDTMQLLINDTMSIFQSQLTGRRDSLLKVSWDTGKDTGLLQGRFPDRYEKIPKARYTIYKYRDSILTMDNYTYHSNRLFNIHFYREPGKLPWQFVNEEQTIGAYTCRKATLRFGSRDWTAWYCPDIPTSDGPYKFGGLPGLIVRMASTDGDWQFTLLSIDSIKQYRSILTDAEIQKRLTTKKGFFDARSYYIRYATSYDLKQNYIALFSEEQRKKQKQEDDLLSVMTGKYWIEY